MDLFKYKASPNDEEEWKRFESLLKQEIYLPLISKLNDPFEAQHVFQEFPPNYIKSHQEKFHALKREFGFDLNFKGDILKDFFNKNGILSLTKNNNNIPMWAYYANTHTGYCLEFELDKGYISKLINKELNLDNGLAHFYEKTTNQDFIFTKVNYVKKVPIVKMAELSQSNDPIEYLINNSIGCKSEDWAHEDEVRLISNVSGVIALPKSIPFLKISGIICGAKMDSDTKKRVQNSCKEHNIRISEAYIDSVNVDYAIQIRSI